MSRRPVNRCGSSVGRRPMRGRERTAARGWGREPGSRPARGACDPGFPWHRSGHHTPEPPSVTGLIPPIIACLVPTAPGATCAFAAARAFAAALISRPVRHSCGAMSILPMVLLPDPILRQRSLPVERVDDDLRRLADDMFETMYEAPGIGLAAVQVGVPRRLITLDVSRGDEPADPLVLINPELVHASGERALNEEGCLSIPDYFADVERPERVRVRWTDLDGREQEREADGLFAVCVQHELDHLEGALFIDHLSRLRRDRVVRKFVKLAREAGRPLGGERPLVA